MGKTKHEKLAVQLSHACWLLMQFPIHRYLMSNAHGRWDGAEKAQRHMELCQIVVAVTRGIELEDVRQTNEADYEAVHHKTQELTDHLDEVIGFPLESDPNYDSLAAMFFVRFVALADFALRTTSTPADDSQPAVGAAGQEGAA